MGKGEEEDEAQAAVFLERIRRNEMNSVNLEPQCGAQHSRC